MIIWETAARALFEEHLAKLRESLKAEKVDPEAAAENLWRQVEIEVGAAGRRFVERGDVERIVADFAASRQQPRAPAGVWRRWVRLASTM